MSEELIQDSLEVAHAIEAALDLNAPYNNLDYSPDDIVTLEDCEIPDHIEDPLRLLRLTLGDERTQALEYAADLELIAQVLRDCVRYHQQQQKGAAQSPKSGDGQEIEG